MEILYLGTGSAEGVPALFCECDHCRYARSVGGREIRTRTNAVIDGKLKLDFGPDTYMQMLREGLDYTHLPAVLITHTHPDHFSPDQFSYRGEFAHIGGDLPLTVYGSERVGELLSPHLSRRVAFCRIRPFEPVLIAGYTVTALEAFHCLGEGAYPVMFGGAAYTRTEEAMLYLVEKGGQSILYAHDTGGIPDADLEYLRGRRLSLVSLDVNHGSWQAGSPGHMGADRAIRAREALLSCGAADEHTVFVANHFSHNGLVPESRLMQLLPGFRVSYDSMRVDLDLPAR